MNVEELISFWMLDDPIRDNFIAKKVVPSRSAGWCNFPTGMHEDLLDMLRTSGVTKLYYHQLSIWENVQSKNNVVISSATASGKSLGYNLPIINTLLLEPEKHALYLFPTKALTQDQFNLLDSFVTNISSDRRKNICAAIYDGDTPINMRKSIKRNANIILTNPDMLHIGILPYHTTWEKLFKNLSFIIIDEIHTYRGVFGSHVANVIRRIKRITDYYRTQPIFLMTSATISNPKEHAEALIENDVVLIDTDTSARGKQTFLFYNPPIVDQELGIRRSPIHETVKLSADLIQNNIQTLIFGRSRRIVELILSYLRKHLTEISAIPKSVIRGYRSGYLPVLRREIENQLKSGEAVAVIGTNALELGINITGLDAVVMMGYPGSNASTIQQSGRAGRGIGESVVILVATADPLDQFLVNHPEYIFEQSPEKVLINPNNIMVLYSHFRCALYELAFNISDSFGSIKSSEAQEYMNILVETREAISSGEKYTWIANKFPAKNISLRNADQSTVTLIELDDNSEKFTTIGVIDETSALWMVHPGAIYVHEGETFLVTNIDLDSKFAKLRRITPDYFTQPQRNTQIDIISISDQEIIVEGRKYQGEIIVTSQVVGFHKVRWHSHEKISTEKLELPSTTLNTTAYWITINQAVINKLRELNLWKNDPINYGSSWQEITEIVRNRDNFICQFCGIKEKNRRHDVHHKIPFRYFSLPDKANSLENLITLCSECHKKAEKDVFVRSGLSGVSYALGHLAPFFLMCDKRDIGVHYDIKSQLSDNDPIIFIYEQIPAGIGFSQRLFEIHDELMRETRHMVASCKCKNGCPSCVGPVGKLDIGGKRDALALLDMISQ